MLQYQFILSQTVQPATAQTVLTTYNSGKGGPRNTKIDSASLPLLQCEYNTVCSQSPFNIKNGQLPFHNQTPLHLT